MILKTQGYVNHRGKLNSKLKNKKKFFNKLQKLGKTLLARAVMDLKIIKIYNKNHDYS